MRFFSITVVDPQDIKVQEGVILSSDTIHEEQPGTRTSSEVLLTSRRQEIPIEGISNPVYSWHNTLCWQHLWYSAYSYIVKEARLRVTGSPFKVRILKRREIGNT